MRPSPRGQDVGAARFSGVKADASCRSIELMETFSFFSRNEEHLYSGYRMRLMILDIYDRMQEALATGRPHHTILDPAPADPRVVHSSPNHSVVR